jgi:hypothetical protein
MPSMERKMHDDESIYVSTFVLKFATGRSVSSSLPGTWQIIPESIPTL